ncbi:MAG: DUF1804 family protein [Bacteroidetes bacterium]|nr:MAG: DUF1804 family protein [Bacteroidota bacterium]
MAYSKERLEAKRLYVEEGKSVKEISTTINVPEKSVYRWSLDDGWEKERETMAMTGVSALKNMLLIAVRQLQEMASGGEIDARKADAIMKVVKAAKSLGKDLDKRGNILLGISEYVEFLRTEHPDTLVEMQPYLVEFGNWVKRKYP